MIICWRTEDLSPALGRLEVLANSILWDPCGMQWCRNGHWPLLATYGTKRYRSEECSSGALPLPKPKQKKQESKADHEESVEHVALAADAPEESADTGGAAGSTDVPTHLRATMFRQRACGIKQDGSATQRDLHPHATDAIDAD